MQRQNLAAVLELRQQSRFPQTTQKTLKVSRIFKGKCLANDSSYSGNIAAIDFIIQKNFKYYIPGHGKTGGADMPRKYRAYLATLRNTIKNLYGQGLADFEMKPKVVEAVEAYKDWAGFDIRVGPHFSRAYLEIEAEAF